MPFVERSRRTTAYSFAVFVGAWALLIGSVAFPALTTKAEANTRFIANCSTGSYAIWVQANGDLTYAQNNSCVGTLNLTGTAIPIKNISGGFIFANKNITGVRFPNTLEFISGYASFGGTGITNLSLPCSLKGITGGQSFQIGVELLSVQMCADGGTPSQDFNMGYYAFGGNENLSRFSFGKTQASSVKVTTWNDAANGTWSGVLQMWIQYCGSDQAMLNHMVAPYLPSNMWGDVFATVSCLKPGDPARAASSSTTTFQASSTNPAPGSTVTLTANVTSAATGTVDFKDQSGNLLCITGNLTNGQASCDWAPVVAGNYTVSAFYEGDDAYLPSTSNGSVISVGTLSALALSSGTLSPGFSTGISSYAVSVGNAVSTITITPTRSQADANIAVNGTSVTSGTASGAINLSVGANTINIVVTDQNGNTQQTYTVTVTRAAVASLSSDALLSGLALSVGTLTPSFSSGTRSYTASVTNSVATGFTITPTKNQSDATTVQYLGADGTTTFTGALSVGENVIRTVVTAQNGTTTSAYTVTVTRAAQENNPSNNTSSITWNDQGATTASSGGSATYTNGSSVSTIPTTPPQKTGHTFIGWFSGATSGSQVTNGSYTPASPYGSVTFYAQWGVNRSSSVGTWTWTNPSSVGTANWHALAASADGSKLFAGVDGGGSLYRSTDFGVTWSAIAGTSGHNWFSIASNIDGTKVAALDYGSDIWTSSDSGSTWSSHRVGGAGHNWGAIASSSSGTRLVAVSGDGHIATSSDSGDTWSDYVPTGPLGFTGVSSSNDGTYLAASTWANGIYTSADSGQTWTARSLPVPNAGSATYLQAVASNGDGSRLVTGSRTLAGGSNGGIIFTSADYGATWKAYAQTNFDYINFVSSGDGSRLSATIYGQPGVSNSSNFGASWTFQSLGSSGVIPIANNIDGSLLFVGGYGGYLWTGKVPNSRVVAVLPSSTSATLAAGANTPATSLSFSASGSASAVTVTPITNPVAEASTPFSVAQASIFDISVVNITGQVTICVGGGPDVRLWHFTNGAWVDVTTSQTATQTCGVTSSFSPFATAPPPTASLVASRAAADAALKAAAEAAEKAAAEAAAAKREAEKQAARADITIKLLGGKDLSVEMFVKAEIFGITATNIAAVQAELLALPDTSRTDINQVLKVAHKYELVGNIGSDVVNYMQSNSFIEIGLIAADSKNKVSLVYAVRKLPTASRDTYAEIKAAVDTAMKEIQARKDRLAAVIARNSARHVQSGATR